MTPSSTTDELLLVDIIQLLNIIIQSQAGTPLETMTWLVGMLLNPKGALYGLLERVDAEKALAETALMTRR